MDIDKINDLDIITLAINENLITQEYFINEDEDINIIYLIEDKIILKDYYKFLNDSNRFVIINKEGFISDKIIVDN
jgi:hypothetical protein